VYVKTTYYPFDVQAFDFNFSKLYFDDTYQQNYYSSEDNVTDNFVSNGEWVFNYQRGQTMRRYTEAHDRNRKIFSDIIWQFEMDRRQTYYVWSFLVPAIALSIASLVTFLLPVKSSEKLVLAVFSFISIAVLIRLFNESLPSTSDHVSKFVIFVSLNLGLGGLVIIVNGFISSVYHRKCPKRCMPCLLCNCCPRTCRNPLDEPVSYFSYRNKTYTVTDKQTTEDMPDSEEEMGVLSQTGISHEEIEPILSPVSQSKEKSMLEDIKNIKNTVETDVESQTEVKQNKRKWSRVALNCDIFWGICFILAYSAVYIWISVELFSGQYNIA